MNVVRLAKQRLEAVIGEVDRLLELDFPCDHTKDGLLLIKELFRKRLSRINNFTADSDPDVVRNECSQGLGALFSTLQYLGFLLRSTTTRNSFEVFWPILRLAGDILEPGIEFSERKTRLVLSSEWEYSPHVYTEIQHLPNFVLLGLPAQESSNPLLLPMIGHELGHVVWRKNNWQSVKPNPLALRIFESIKEYVFINWSEYREISPAATERPEENIFFSQSIAPAFSWLMRQVEEAYCDFVGVKVFQESFFKAFSYLLAPGLPGVRSPDYPGLKTRMEMITSAANHWGISLKRDYVGLFDEEGDPSSGKSDEFMLKAADYGLKKLFIDIVDLVDASLSGAILPIVSPDGTRQILNRFEKGVPAEKISSIVDLLSAGWEAEASETLWGGDRALSYKKKETIIELVCKSFEIYEIEQRVGGVK